MRRRLAVRLRRLPALVGFRREPLARFPFATHGLVHPVLDAPGGCWPGPAPRRTALRPWPARGSVFFLVRPFRINVADGLLQLCLRSYSDCAPMSAWSRCSSHSSGSLSLNHLCGQQVRRTPARHDQRLARRPLPRQGRPAPRDRTEHDAGGLLQDAWVRLACWQAREPYRPWPLSGLRSRRIVTARLGSGTIAPVPPPLPPGRGENL